MAQQQFLFDNGDPQDSNSSHGPKRSSKKQKKSSPSNRSGAKGHQSLNKRPAADRSGEVSDNATGTEGQTPVDSLQVGSDRDRSGPIPSGRVASNGTASPQPQGDRVGDATPANGQPTESSEQPVLSVSELNATAKYLLEKTLPLLWVSGEVSGFSRAQSGHCYFSLRDDQSQVKATVRRKVAEALPFEIHDGLEVLVQAQLTVYIPRGEYQLAVRHLEPQGLGALELALRQRVSKLQAAGLFDPQRKRPLPPFPKRVAFVTSPTGAAVRDFLEVLRRRFPGTDVLVIPTRVQGPQAAEEIAAAIRLANRHASQLQIEVLAVGRGGGSPEDLWSFNEEQVAWAIFESNLPVVSAVGHEIDLTIADLVADRRALTPSEAAELIVPSRDDLALLIQQHRRRLHNAILSALAASQSRYQALASRPAFRRPERLAAEASRRLGDFSERLIRAISHRYQIAAGQLADHAGRLEALSPLSVLARGYSVTTRHDQPDGSPVRDAALLSPGQLLVTQFASGQAISRIEELNTTNSAQLGKKTP